MTFNYYYCYLSIHINIVIVYYIKLLSQINYRWPMTNIYNIRKKKRREKKKMDQKKREHVLSWFGAHTIMLIILSFTLTHTHSLSETLSCISKRTIELPWLNWRGAFFLRGRKKNWRKKKRRKRRGYEGGPLILGVYYFSIVCM